MYVVDTMGELRLFINASDVAFIGGSLVEHGGHNLLEASVSGVPVVFGPHMFTFEKVVELVLEKDAGVQVDSVEELGEVVIKLLGDPILRDRYASNGRQLIEENRGALDFVIRKLLFEVLQSASRHFLAAEK